MKNNTVSTSNNNNVGSAILAISGLISRTFRSKPTPQQVRCQIVLERNGIIRPVDDRIKTNKVLTASAHKAFAKLAKGGDDGAAKVIQLANELTNRNMAIVVHKTDLVLG